MREALPPPAANARAPLSTVELVFMVAALSALNALAIDIMLPALPDISAEYALANANDRQLVVVIYVVFFGIAQLVYGPLADAYGRRSVLLGALTIFALSTMLCVVAPRFELLLAARALQGVGAAATRVIATAVVRDLCSGRRMAQIMSMAMTVFMIVPIAAPGVGQLVLFVAEWRWIFGALLIYTIAVLAWTMTRLPETLAWENRIAFGPRAIARAYAAVLRERTTFWYMIATTCLTACLFAYIAASEQIFVDTYGLGAAFPLAFASVAVAITAGAYLNSRLVMRLGMRRISHTMILWFTLISAAHALVLAAGVHSFWTFLLLLIAALIGFGLIAGNFNALAMEPVGRIAGSASALYGAFTASVGAAIGGVIGRFYDGTALPFIAGMAIMGALSIAALLWVERGRLFRDPA
ncbi:MAG: multidrug effflux MFS transporter [Hydrogenophilaceae bacterium]|jgi:DHA1 family bicyclomycin/chloramphenicol resistance-like MFS transporter|nr:multidrug effflux MFS transporter [Hydrogenophilaceae bacterium]